MKQFNKEVTKDTLSISTINSRTMAGTTNSSDLPASQRNLNQLNSFGVLAAPMTVKSLLAM
jgi:hypothetical protein